MAHRWERVPNTTYVMKTLQYFLLQLFKILSNSSSPSPPNFTSAVNFWSLVCLTEWVIMPHLMCYFSFDDIMVLYMSCFGTLVPERPCYMFDATRNQVYWSLTHNVIFSGTLIWYHKHIYTHKDIQHTQGPIDWHTHINIYQHHLAYAHSRYLYYTN